MKWKIIDIEKLLGKKIKKNILSVGFDLAEYSTGVCFLRTSETELYVDKFQIIEISRSKELTIIDKLELYLKELFKLRKTIKKINVSVIEDCHLQYFGRKPNVWTVKILSRFETLVWAIFRKYTDYSYFKQAQHARLSIGFKSRRKKKIEKTIKNNRKKKETVKLQVKNWLKKQFKLNIEKDDLADAFVLALNGLLC